MPFSRAEHIYFGGRKCLVHTQYQKESQVDSAKNASVTQGTDKLRLLVYRNPPGVLQLGVAKRNSTSPHTIPLRTPSQVAYAVQELPSLGINHLTQHRWVQETLVSFLKKMVFFYVTPPNPHAHLCSYVERPITARKLKHCQQKKKTKNKTKKKKN